MELRPVTHRQRQENTRTGGLGSEVTRAAESREDGMRMGRQQPGQSMMSPGSLWPGQQHVSQACPLWSSHCLYLASAKPCPPAAVIAGGGVGGGLCPPRTSETQRFIIARVKTTLSIATASPSESPRGKVYLSGCDSVAGRFEVTS